METEKNEEIISEVEGFVPPKRMPTFAVVLLCVAGTVALAAATFFGARAIFRSSLSRTRPQDFCLAGLTFTLDSSFSVYAGQENSAMSPEYALTVLTEEFSRLDGMNEMSAHDYLTLVRNNRPDAGAVETAANGLEYFTFSDVVNDACYYYFIFAFKGANTFYVGEFLCLDETDAESRADLFADWAVTAREDTPVPTE